MADPITISGVCGIAGTQLVDYWNCWFQVAFFNDITIFSLFFLLILAIIGFVLRLPMGVMAVFGFGVIMGLLYITNSQIFLAVALAGIILFGIFTLMALFRGGNLAQR